MAYGWHPLGAGPYGSNSPPSAPLTQLSLQWFGNSVACRVTIKTTRVVQPKRAIGRAGIIWRRATLRKVEIPGGNYVETTTFTPGAPVFGQYLPVAAEPVEGSGLGPIVLEATTDSLIRFSFKTRIIRRPMLGLGRAGLVQRSTKLIQVEQNSNPLYAPGITPVVPPPTPQAVTARPNTPRWAYRYQLRRPDWTEIGYPSLWHRKPYLYGQQRKGAGPLVSIGAPVFVTTGYLEAWGPPPVTNVFVTTGYLELWGSPTPASAITVSASVGAQSRAAASNRIKQFISAQVSAKSRVTGVLSSAAGTVIGFCRVSSLATAVAVGTNIMRFFAQVRSTSRVAQDVQNLFAYQQGRVTATSKARNTPTIIPPTQGHYLTMSSSWVKANPHIANPFARISQLTSEIAAVAAAKARVGQATLEVAAVGSKARVGQTALEVAAVGSKARISNLALEVAGALDGEAQCSQLILEVMVYDYYQPGPPMIYPNFTGLSFSVMRSAIFYNLPVQTGQTGKDVRLQGSTVPRWKFDLEYGGLRDEIKFREYALMLGFFYQQAATNGYFLFRDIDDNQVESQVIATTYATSPIIDTLYTLKRTYCGITEPVGYVDTTNPFNIYLDGKLVPYDRYYIMQDIVGNQLLKFKDTPEPGQVITADMSYFYAVRFENPTMDLEQFVHGFYQAKQVSLLSLRSNNPLTVVP